MDKIMDKITDKITDKFCVIVRDPIMSEALQKLAFQKGWMWSDSTKKVSSLEKLALFFENGRITHSDARYARQQINLTYMKLISLGEVLEILLPPQVEQIDIGGYEVVILQDKQAIQVGCQKISKEKVKEILDILNQ